MGLTIKRIKPFLLMEQFVFRRSIGLNDVFTSSNCAVLASCSGYSSEQFGKCTVLIFWSRCPTFGLILVCYFCVISQLYFRLYCCASVLFCYSCHSFSVSLSS